VDAEPAHRPRLLNRLLSAGHFLLGALAVAAAGWTTWSAIAVLAYMSSPLSSLHLLISAAVPQALFGAWMCILGRRLWNGVPCRIALVATHGVLLMIGLFAVGVGAWAVRPAVASTARGGGIMSPLAWFPILAGLPLLALAVPSLLAVAFRKA
jgi:hypothetical protein